MTTETRKFIHARYDNTTIRGAALCVGVYNNLETVVMYVSHQRWDENPRKCNTQHRVWYFEQEA